MSSEDTLREKVVDEYGNIRSDEQGHMNGSDVFNFVIVEVPKDIKWLVAASGEDIQTIDYYVFHQANAFINNHIAKKNEVGQGKDTLDNSEIRQYIFRVGSADSQNSKTRCKARRRFL